MPSLAPIPIEEQLLRVRAVKNEEEIKLMKGAARIVDVGLEAGLAMMKPGMTENQVYGRVLSATQEAGSEGPPFFALCASGERTLHSTFATDKLLRPGDPVIVDVGAIFHGYIGDASRTGIVEKGSKEIEDLYTALLDAHTSGIRAVRPGIKASEVDRKIRETLKEAGYPDYSASSGHGIGLGEVELPWITTHEEAGLLDMTLMPGMTFSLEPGTHKPGVGAVKIEDNILVTDTGHEVMTKTKYLSFDQSNSHLSSH
jgi:Xaa-Pro aminopeptidase